MQTIIDGPFALNPPTGNTTAGQAAFGSASHSIFNTRTSDGRIIPPKLSEPTGPDGFPADTDQALRNMSSLFGSFRLPEQLSQNLPRPQPWKPKNKTAAPDPNKGANETAAEDKKPTGLKEPDDILEVSADEFDDDTTVASKDQKVAAEGANGTEEQKKKKNRRKKRTRK